MKVSDSNGNEVRVTVVSSHSLDWSNPADRPALAEAIGPAILAISLGKERLAADLAEAFDPKNPEDAEPDGNWETQG